MPRVPMLSKLSPRSILMVLASAVFGRMSTALAQIVAAIYLSPSDFGLFATASGILAACTILRGGGTGNHVQTMTTEEFDSDAGRFFRYSLLFTLLGASLMLGATWIVSRQTTTDAAKTATDLTVCCLVLAVGFVASNITVFPRAKMLSDLRLSEISTLDAASGLIKLMATWLLARSGFGPAALAAPIVISSLFESAWTWPRSGLNRQSLAIREPWLLRTFLEMRLPLVMALLASLNAQSDTFVASAFLPASVLGFYFFASQIASQPSMLVANSLRSIFTAATARVRDDEEKSRASIRDVFSGSMVFMPLVSMAVPSIFDSFERALWQGKWSESRIPILILSASLVYPVTLQLVAAPIAGVRNWTTAIRIDLLRALARILPALIAGASISLLGLAPSISGFVLAVSVGGTSALMASVELSRILSHAGMPRHTIIYELYSTPLAALLSAVAAAGLAHSAAEPLRAILGDRGAAGIECVIAGSVYSMLAVILLRFGYTATLERLVAALPEFMRAPARRLFVL